MNRERRIIRESLSEEKVHGDTFIMSDSHPADDHKPNSVEMRSGESTERVMARNETASQIERKPVEHMEDADLVEGMFRDCLQTRNPYSETIKLRPDGSLDNVRADGVATYLDTKITVRTPEDLYRFAKEIEGRNQNIKFSFETDPEGGWLKYTVTKKE